MGRIEQSIINLNKEQKDFGERRKIQQKDFGDRRDFREKIIEMSRKHGGEKYIESFNGYTHLVTMLYAVIQRFDSLREIETSMTADVRKLHHVGIDTVPKRSTLSEANATCRSL